MHATTPADPVITTGQVDLTPAAAWSRRVRRIGGFIQAAFAALWLIRASLAIGGRAQKEVWPQACNWLAARSS